MTARPEIYDVLIAGGGLVGSSLALALAPLGLRLGVIEPVPPQVAAQAGYDDRSTALAYGTRRVFEALQLWPAIAPEATPIAQVHVSERGRFGVTRLHAGDYDMPALGYVTPNRVLNAALGTALTAAPVSVLSPLRVTGVNQTSEFVQLDAEHDGVTQHLQTRLLVAADGARSFIRTQLQVPTVDWDYGQHAVIANVTPAVPHANIAYERFTRDGPIALLPLSDNRCAVVCAVQADAVEGVLALDETVFAAFLQRRFGGRLGGFSRIGARAHYPLRLIRARQQVCGRVVFAGNAAHNLHPIAGQSFNLSLRDCAALAEALAAAPDDSSGDCGAPAVLQRYARMRTVGQYKTVLFTDGLLRLFGNPLLPMRLARGLGLVGLELLPLFKHALARQGMGLNETGPRLLRGLPLDGARHAPV